MLYDFDDKEDMKRQLEEEEKHLELIQESYSKVQNEKVELFAKKLEEYDPIINFISIRGYKFTHPDIELTTSKGLVIGENSSESLLFIYNIESSWVEQYNIHSRETERELFLDEFLKVCDFEVALKGIMGLENYMSNQMKIYQGAIDEDEAIIEKYKYK